MVKSEATARHTNTRKPQNHAPGSIPRALAVDIDIGKNTTKPGANSSPIDTFLSHYLTLARPIPDSDPLLQDKE